MLTQEQIQAIQAREQAATPAERGDYDPILYPEYYDCGPVGFETEADREFVAHARQDVPDLLQHIQEREQAFKEVLQKIKSQSDGDVLIPSEIDSYASSLGIDLN
jgi:hypothetical protein